jgi:catechol 2,3-dioxygenase-like lactoylglutathione lyase family enzyme
VKPENLFHAGIVVDDLDATLDWFTRVAGYRWTDVVEVDQAAETPDGEVTVHLRMVFSAVDPRLEFQQAAPGTIWVPADSGVHHLGYWSDDVESDLATLEANGTRYEVKSFNPDGSGTLLWAYCKGSTGPRIELVSRALEPFIEYLWSTAGSTTT